MIANEQALLDYVAAHPGSRRGEIRHQVAPEASDATIWRALKRLVAQGRLAVSGNGPATGYALAGADAVQSHLHEAVRRNVLERHGFRRDRTLAMATDAEIPKVDREQVVDYVGTEIRGLHEGNAIRYRLTTDDLVRIGAGGVPGQESGR